MDLEGMEFATVLYFSASELENFFSDKVLFLHKLNNLMNDFEVSRTWEEAIESIGIVEEDKEFSKKYLEIYVKRSIIEDAYQETIRSRVPIVTNDKYLASILSKDVIFMSMQVVMAIFNRIIMEQEEEIEEEENNEVVKPVN